MRCEAFEDRLNAVLDERRRPEWDADLVEHTAGCPACRQLAAAYRILLDGFYELAIPDPPADLAERVLEDRARLRRPTIRWWVATPALATAAALLLALFPWSQAPENAAPQNAAPQATQQLAARGAARSHGPAALAHLSILPRSTIPRTYERHEYPPEGVRTIAWPTPPR